MPRLSRRQLDELRCCVRSDLSSMPDDEIAQALDESLAELPSTVTEDFMKTLGSLGKAVGPTLERAAPSIIQGAASGASVGGPWGAVIGAGMGLASSALSKPAPPPAASTPGTGVPVPAASQVPTPTPAQAATPTASPTPTPTAPQAPALPSGQSAAATIISLLDNPVIRNSLLSQVLGSTGTQQVATPSGVSVPRAAINSLLTHLLTNATEELPESESVSELTYLMNDSGEYIVDPASPDQHAALVLSYLRPSQRTAETAANDFGDFLTEDVEWTSEDSDDAEGGGYSQESEESEEIVEFY